MPLDRKSGSSNYTATELERRREAGYKELGRRMKRNYESPGLRGESSVGQMSGQLIEQAVPRRKD